jgi:prepilin-type N-terminal cleavage/methylation domain-containing protein/prepilin-type processing-associated H-X9-DG protein
MTRLSGPRGYSRLGFTLIELLVVVAIIALLISILLPSLSKARAQARGTLCSSRIAQLGKAMCIYADDFAEAPPFLGRGWEDCWDTSRLNSETIDGLTLGQWASLETWLMSDPHIYWMLEQKDWPLMAQVRNGSLFSYTRFETLYRCPEFERINDSTKSQNVFNYTRTFLGRKWFTHLDTEGQMGSPYVPTSASDNWCGIAGPILKLSQIHAPGQMWMLFDERWDKHCAAPPEVGRQAGGGILDRKITEVWMEVDPIFGATGDEIGQYHGAPKRAPSVPASVQALVPAIKSGNIAYYDGHVTLDTDPLPERKIDGSTLDMIPVFLDWITGPLFAQRGILPAPGMFEAPI